MGAAWRDSAWDRASGPGGRAGPSGRAGPGRSGWVRAVAPATAALLSSPHLKNKVSGLRLIRNVLRESGEDGLFDWAAVLSFYFLFALFPALLFLSALSATLHLSQLVGDVLRMMSYDLPRPAATLVNSAMVNLLRHHVPGLISVGVVLLLYSAAQGFAALIRALNVIYEVHETRPLWRLILVALGLTWSAGLLAAIALAGVLLGRRIVMLVVGTRIAGTIAIVAPVVRWGVTIVFMVIALVLIYRTAPNARIKGGGSNIPAAVLALVLWGIATGGLAAYIAHFAPYGSLYGSLGAVIALMLWFYLVALSILVGAEFHDEWLKMKGIEVVSRAPGRQLSLPISPRDRAA